MSALTVPNRKLKTSPLYRFSLRKIEEILGFSDELYDFVEKDDYLLLLLWSSGFDGIKERHLGIDKQAVLEIIAARATAAAASGFCTVGAKIARSTTSSVFTETHYT